MSFNGWRIMGVFFIMMSVYNLTRFDYVVHEWLMYVDMLSLAVWSFITIFEGEK